MEEQIAKIYEIVESMKTVVDELMNENKALKDRQNELESLLYDQVLTPAKEAFDKHEYDCGLAEFTERNGEKLSPYADSMKAIEGDDFDLIKETYDGFNSYEPEEGEEKPEESVYVDAMVDKVKTTLDAIREKLGAKEVTAEVSEEGLEYKADGETVPEEVVEDAVEEKVSDEVVEDSEPKEEKATEDAEKSEEDKPAEESIISDIEITPEGETAEDKPEDIEAFMKELEAELPNYK